MGLQDFWFIALAVLFLGFFVLEGFDFGVGMLMKPFGRVRQPATANSTGAPCSTRSDRSGTATRSG